MNVYRPIVRATDVELSPDGMLTIPEPIRRATGLIPGRPVVIGLNDSGQLLVLTRAQAKRLGETPEDRGARFDAVLAALGNRFSTGQSTDEIMDALRGPRDA